MKDPRTYEELSPQTFGRDRSIVLGKHSGTASVAVALLSLGLTANELQMRLLLKQIHERSIQAKRTVSMDELLEFYVQISDGTSCKSLLGEMPS